MILLGYLGIINLSTFVGFSRHQKYDRVFYMLNEKQIRETAESLLPAMRGMYRGLCANEVNAEDELHEGYAHLVTYVLPNYRGGSNVRTFALQALRRRYYNRAKAHHNTRRHSFIVPKDKDEAQGVDSIADVASPSAFASLFEAQRLENALKVLTADERALCVAFMKLGDWCLAAKEVGVSTVQASRMLGRIRVMGARQK